MKTIRNNDRARKPRIPANGKPTPNLADQTAEETLNRNLNEALPEPMPTADAETPARRGRKQKVTAAGIIPEQAATLVKPILALIESASGLPFSKCDPQLHAAVHAAVADCLNLYGGEFMAKYMPLLSLATGVGALAMQAASIKKQTVAALPPSEE